MHDSSLTHSLIREMAHDFQRNLRRNLPGFKARNVEQGAPSLPAKLHVDSNLPECQEELVQEWPTNEFSSSDSEYDSPVEEDMYEEPEPEAKMPFSYKTNSAEKPYIDGVRSPWENNQQQQPQPPQPPQHEIYETAEDSYIDPNPNPPPQVIRSLKPMQANYERGRGIVTPDPPRPPALKNPDFRPPVSIASHPASNPVNPRQGFVPTLANQDIPAARKVCNQNPKNPQVPKKPPIPGGGTKQINSEYRPPVPESGRPKIGQNPGRKSDQAPAIKKEENNDCEEMQGPTPNKLVIPNQLPGLIALGGDKGKLKATNGPRKLSDVSAQASSPTNSAGEKNGRLALADSLNNMMKLRNKNDMDSQTWYTNSCDRPKAAKALEKMGKSGAFLVRKSAQACKDQPYTLSLLYKGTVYNLRIRWMEGVSKYALGNEKEGEEIFDSVVEMIENYQKRPLNLISGQQGEISQCKLEYPVKIPSGNWS
ncbi:SH2 domain-containing protein 6-like isoform X2 [Lethenteron reissneri]|uniref:SH2 domain-containing protein 6-like isoform X2 n=1 Tax=Lethenteron reissneri TaxID=7753 RepID=UPI002AB770F9|nr:SH2 domain-containing protein 6-like isoform X2 [Lethenteron reissneri]